jgi:hypothetical protein
MSDSAVFGLSCQVGVIPNVNAKSGKALTCHAAGVGAAMSHRYTHVGKEALAKAGKTLPEI